MRPNTTQLVLAHYNSVLHNQSSTNPSRRNCSINPLIHLVAYFDLRNARNARNTSFRSNLQQRMQRSKHYNWCRFSRAPSRQENHVEIACQELNQQKHIRASSKLVPRVPGSEKFSSISRIRNSSRSCNYRRNPKFTLLGAQKRDDCVHKSKERNEWREEVAALPASIVGSLLRENWTWRRHCQRGLAHPRRWNWGAWRTTLADEIWWGTATTPWLQFTVCCRSGRESFKSSVWN